MTQIEGKEKEIMRRLLLLVVIVLTFSGLLFGHRRRTSTSAPTITSPSTATFVAGSANTFGVVAKGNPVPTITITGSLPNYVTFTGTTLTATPNVAPTTTPIQLTFTAKNSVLPNAVQNFTLNVTPAPPQGLLWQPSSQSPIRWEWLLSTTPAASSLLTNIGVYDVDGFDSSAELVNAMHARSIHAICYIDAGTWENWRSDAGPFPASVLGAPNGWPGERWLDIRQIKLLAPIMTARFQMCKDKGFDAVEPDNIDGYTNGPGFPLTASDQIAYNEWIATTVHGLGMSVALKNDGDQIATLLPFFDFDINEQCVQYSECDMLKPFVMAGKAVFETEYNGNQVTTKTTSACSQLTTLNFNGIETDLNLDVTALQCR
jgi:hypothetical protein